MLLFILLNKIRNESVCVVFNVTAGNGNVYKSISVAASEYTYRVGLNVVEIEIHARRGQNSPPERRGKHFCVVVSELTRINRFRVVAAVFKYMRAFLGSVPAGAKACCAALRNAVKRIEVNFCAFGHKNTREVCFIHPLDFIMLSKHKNHLIFISISPQDFIIKNGCLRGNSP